MERGPKRGGKGRKKIRAEETGLKKKKEEKKERDRKERERKKGWEHADERGRNWGELTRKASEN